MNHFSLKIPPLLCCLHFLVCHSAHGQIDSLFNAYKAENDVRLAQSIFHRLGSVCKQDVSCYKPVVDFLSSNVPLGDLKCRTHSHLASALISAQLMEEGKNAALRGIAQISKYEQNKWLMLLHLSAGICYSFLTKVDSALYHAGKAEQLIRTLHEESYQYRPDYIRYNAYESIRNPDLALHYLNRAYASVKDSEDRMNKGFILIELLRFTQAENLSTEFDTYLKEYIRFSEAGNTSADAMHSHLEFLFKDDKEGITILEDKIKAILADTLSGRSGISPSTTKMKLIDLYTIYGESDKAITELRSILNDTTVHRNEQIMNGTYQRLIRNFEHQKQVDSAYKYAVFYGDFLVNTYQQNLAQHIAEYEVRFQTQEKDRALAEQQLVIQKSKVRQRTLWAILSLLAITALFGGIYYRRRLAYQKEISMKDKELNLNRIKELEHQNTLLALNAMIEGQETERLRIAQDLHDGLGGLLTTVKAHFTTIQREIENLQSINVFDRTNKLIDEACNEVRRIAHDMVPHSIQISGLTGALEELESAIELRGIHCALEIHHFSNENLSHEKASMIYRVIQEITNNAVKHSGASNIHIQLIGHQRMLHIMVEDNGKGFDINTIANNRGMGLSNIDSRVKYLGGTIQYDSSPKHGTIVNMDVPM